MKQQPKQWLAPGEGTPMKAKTIFTAGKAMATAFFYYLFIQGGDVAKQ